MPSQSMDGQFFRDAAAMLRGMADVLEQEPEEVTGINYNMSTSNYLLGGVPFEREYHVIIRTRPKREETT